MSDFYFISDHFWQTCIISFRIVQNWDLIEENFWDNFYIKIMKSKNWKFLQKNQNNLIVIWKNKKNFFVRLGTFSSLKLPECQKNGKHAFSVETPYVCWIGVLLVYFII